MTTTTDKVIEYLEPFVNRFAKCHNGEILRDLMEYYESENCAVEIIPDDLKIEYPNVKVLGGGSTGIIFYSSKFPDKVLKWIHETQDLEGVCDFQMYDLEYVGFSNIVEQNPLTDLDNPAINKMSKSIKRIKELPSEVRCMLVKTYAINGIGDLIVNEYRKDFMRIVDVIDYRELEFNEDDILNFCKCYKSLIDEGLFLSDLIVENMTVNINTGKPILLDLDYLMFCEELKSLSQDHTHFDELLHMSHSFLHLKELRYLKERVSNLYPKTGAESKPKNLISTNPLET